MKNNFSYNDNKVLSFMNFSYFIDVSVTSVVQIGRFTNMAQEILANLCWIDTSNEIKLEKNYC